MGNTLKGVIDISAPNVAKVANDVAQAVTKISDSLNGVTPAANKASKSISTIGNTVPAPALQNAMERITATIENAANEAVQFKTKLVDLGNARLPLTSLNQYEASIRRIKLGLDQVSFSNIDSGVDKEIPKIDSTARAIKILENQLIRLKKIASQPLGFNDLTRVNGLIAKTQGQLNTFNATLNRTGKAGADATGDLINLGRVVQDAPFGFIGIANNLNPLIEGFKRTSAQAGGFKGAMKALGTSLMGAGGLSLAVSAISTGLILFGDKLFSASGAADKTAEAAKKLKEQIQGIFESVGKEAADTAALVAVLKSETETRERKLEALKELKKIQPEIFGGLKLEENSVKGVDAAYQAYIANLRNVIAVKIKQAQIESKITQLLTLQGAALTKNEKKLVDGINNFRKQLAEQTRGQSGASSFLDNVIKEDEKKLDRLNEDIKGFLEELTELSKGVKIDIPDPKTDKVDKTIEKTIAQAKRLAEFLDENTIRAFRFEVDPRDTLKQTFERAKQFIKDATERFNADGTNKFKIKFFPQVVFEGGLKGLSDPDNFKGLKAQTQDLAEKLEKEIDQLTKRNPILIQFNAEQIRIKGIDEKIKQAGQTLISNISSAFAGAFEGIGTAIGDAISGGDFGQAIFAVIGDLITQIGRALIQFAIVKGILDKILKNPINIGAGTALAAGIAAIAIGQIVKNIKPKGYRASGGGVAAGQAIMVGERGREVFVPNSAGRIVSNEAINGGSAGRVQVSPVQVTGEFVINGNNLIAVIANASRSQNRLS